MGIRYISSNIEDIETKVLGLDCSSSTIGFSLISNELKLLSYGHLKPLKSDNNLFDRLYDVFLSIEELCQTFNPSHIVIEDIILSMPGGKSSAQTITTLAVFNRMVGFSVFFYTGIQPELLPVGTIRKIIRNKYESVDPKFKKEHIPDIIRQNLDSTFSNILNRNDKISTETFDEADAIAVAWAYILKEQNERPI